MILQVRFVGDGARRALLRRQRELHGQGDAKARGLSTPQVITLAPGKGLRRHRRSGSGCRQPSRCAPACVFPSPGGRYSQIVDGNGTGLRDWRFNSRAKQADLGMFPIWVLPQDCVGALCLPQCVLRVSSPLRIGGSPLRKAFINQAFGLSDSVRCLRVKYFQKRMK